MNTQQVADRLVELCRKGENMQALQELYHQDIVSKEMPGAPNAEIKGMEAVLKKTNEWFASVEEMHGAETSDPIVAGDHFTCKMSFDCTFKERGRMQMEEVSVFKVNNGKIVEEQFFYDMPGQ